RGRPVLRLDLGGRWRERSRRAAAIDRFPEAQTVALLWVARPRARIERVLPLEARRRDSLPSLVRMSETLLHSTTISIALGEGAGCAAPRARNRVTFNRGGTVPVARRTLRHAASMSLHAQRLSASARARPRQLQPTRC